MAGALGGEVVGAVGEEVLIIGTAKGGVFKDGDTGSGELVGNDGGKSAHGIVEGLRSHIDGKLSTTGIASSFELLQEEEHGFIKGEVQMRSGGEKLAMHAAFFVEVLAPAGLVKAGVGIVLIDIVRAEDFFGEVHAEFAGAASEDVGERIAGEGNEVRAEHAVA